MVGRLRPLPFPPRLSGHRNFFHSFFSSVFRHKIAGNGFWIWAILFLQNFWAKRAVFLSKYFKKPFKDCEFAEQQHDTLILIFGYVVLNKIYLIFQRQFGNPSPHKDIDIDKS